MKTQERLRSIDESITYLRCKLMECRRNRSTFMAGVILDKLWYLHRRRQYVVLGIAWPETNL